jgi:peptidyl-prolyl cis-trans isomerase C
VTPASRLATIAADHEPRTQERRREMARARARHILVDTYDEAEALLRELENGADFGQLAAEHSKCPSGSSGGDLGEFSPGQMVEEFDRVVFNDAVGVVHGPVQTQFGYHLIEVTSRSD